MASRRSGDTSAGSSAGLSAGALDAARRFAEASEEVDAVLGAVRPAGDVTWESLAARRFRQQLEDEVVALRELSCLLRDAGRAWHRHAEAVEESAARAARLLPGPWG